jgi:hypothetical protein
MDIPVNMGAFRDAIQLYHTTQGLGLHRPPHQAWRGASHYYPSLLNPVFHLALSQNCSNFFSVIKKLHLYTTIRRKPKAGAEFAAINQPDTGFAIRCVAKH